MVNLLTQSLGKKHDVLTKCSNGTLNIHYRVAKYNKNEFQNLHDIKGTGEGFVKFRI